MYRSKAASTTIDDVTEKNFKKLGYTDEQLRKIKDQLAKAGLE